MLPRSTLVRLLSGILAASLPLVASLVVVPEARAGFHHHRRGCGCSTCHHRGWHRGCHGSSGGSFGGSSGGSAGGSTGTAAAAPKPAAAAPAPAAAPAAPAKAAGLVPADGAVLVVEVPEEARVFINGTATALAGGVRHFVASGLSADNRYAYEVRVARGPVGAAADTAAGRADEETRTVWLEAGQQQVVSFKAAADRDLALARPALAAPDASALMTHLTLRVPADAKVWIAGQPTSRTGAVRRFSTAALAAGQAWDDYEVRVVRVVDGRAHELVRRLTLTGGTAVDLALDPAAADVATTAALAP